MSYLLARSQKQGGKNWILPKKLTLVRNQEKQLMSLNGTEWRERGMDSNAVYSFLACRIIGSTISKPNQLPESESTSASVELPESRLMAFSSSDRTPSAGPPSAWTPSAGFSVSSEETVKNHFVTGVSTEDHRKHKGSWDKEKAYFNS
jgi:hypothetical protein